MSKWQTGEMPTDGTVFYARTISVFRFKLYSPKSEQFRNGIKGRWQEMGEYGGWDNCPQPNGLEWTPDNPFKEGAA